MYIYIIQDTNNFSSPDLKNETHVELKCMT